MIKHWKRQTATILETNKKFYFPHTKRSAHRPRTKTNQAIWTQRRIKAARTFDAHFRRTLSTQRKLSMQISNTNFQHNFDQIIKTSNKDKHRCNPRTEAPQHELYLRRRRIETTPNNGRQKQVKMGKTL